MYYIAKEFEEKFEEKIESLGINPKFKENPAYPILLGKLKSLMYSMNMMEDYNNVRVKQEDGEISFEYQYKSADYVGEKYTIRFFSPDKNTIQCIRFCEQQPRKDGDKVLREKSVCDRIIKIDPSSGFIDYYDNQSLVYGSYDKGITVFDSAEHDYYTSGGIVRDKEIRKYNTEMKDMTYDRYDESSMRYIPAMMFKGTFSNIYNSREMLTRDQLDVARHLRIERKNGRDEIVYSTKIPLSTEHGLMDMYPIGGGPYREMEIQPLSQEEIEKLIKMHKNPKTQEVLRLYAKDRDKFYYNSAEDRNFVYNFDEPEEYKPKTM